MSVLPVIPVTIPIGDRLATTHTALADKLRAATFENIIKMIYETLTPFLTPKPSEKPVFSVTISLSALNIDPEQLRDEKTSNLFDLLQTWAASEKLKLNVLWKHPDCSYCESCGSGCMPTKLQISWDHQPQRT